MKSTKKLKIDNEAIRRYTSEKLPDDDSRRLVAKMLSCGYNLNSLPAIFRELEIVGVTPSAYKPMDCMRILTENAKKAFGQKHPVNTVDMLTDEHDVIVTPEKLVYTENGKDITIKSKMGMFAMDKKDIVVACASTLLAYVTDEDKGVSNVFSDKRKNTIMKMPSIDFIPERSLMSTNDIKSATMSRDYIFEKMKANTVLGLVATDVMYSKIEYHSKSQAIIPKLTNSLKKLNRKREKQGEDPINVVITGSLPGLYREDYDTTMVTLDKIISFMHVTNQTIGGGDNKRGALSGCYMFGELTGATTKKINMCREIISIGDFLGTSIVRLGANKKHNIDLYRMLVANSRVVISPKGRNVYKPTEKGEIVPGHYAFAYGSALEVAGEMFTEPAFTKKGITWHEKSFDSEFEAFKAASENNTLICEVTLTPMIEEKFLKGEINILPSIKPHHCKVWIMISLESDPDVKAREGVLLKHKKRFVSSILSRVKFPLTRRPYYSSDPYQNFFKPNIIVPKTVKKIKEEVEYDVTVSIRAVESSKEMEDVYDSILADEKESVEITDEMLANVKLKAVLSHSDLSGQLQALNAVMQEDNYKRLEVFMLRNKEFENVLKQYNEMADRLSQKPPEQKTEKVEEREEVEDDSSSEDNVDDLMDDLASTMDKTQVSRKDVLGSHTKKDG